MKRVCGLDVHKDNAFVCILGENGEKIEFKTGVLTVELDSFRDKLVELGVGEVAMESTAVLTEGLSPCEHRREPSTLLLRHSCKFGDFQEQDSADASTYMSFLYLSQPIGIYSF